jgi:peptide chain release factor 1
MTAVPQEKLDRIVQRFATLEHQLSSGASGEAFVKLSKEYAEIEPAAKAAQALVKAYDERRGVEDMLKAGGELAEMAAAERATLDATIARLEHDIRLLLLPKDAADERNVILEVRAGTGGDEAAIFAGDLFRMYQRYAAFKGWRVEIISASDGEHGGYKEVIANINGSGVYARMKFESGVHRVQRVPVTETQGRIHTSAATVAGLPEPRNSTSRSTTRTCASTCSAPLVRAASRSTPPIRRCASPTSRPASWSASRTRRASTRTRPRR